MARVDPRRSPLQGFAAGRGWPELFVGPSVSLREVPFVSQVNLRVEPQSELAARAGQALGLDLPVAPNTTATGGLRTALWPARISTWRISPARSKTPRKTSATLLTTPSVTSSPAISIN